MESSTKPLNDKVLHSAITDIVRGFFCGYISGKLDRRQPRWRQAPDAQLVRAVIMEAYPDVANVFCHVTFPIILSARFASYEAAQQDMDQHHFNKHTSVKLLMRYACGSKEAYDVMVATYREEMLTLLDGHFTGDIDNDRAFFQRAVMESHDVGFHKP